MQALDLPNLRDAPFRLGIGPAEAVEHRPWCKARDEALAALARPGAHVGLLGGAGSGKTLLLHALARTLQDQGRAVRVGDRGAALPTLADDVILLLDDAEQLDADALARLAGSKGSYVLAGPPALAERLPRPFSMVALSPLSPDDIARFVAMRLAAAGQRRDLMQPDAVLALARLSGGSARQINALAGAAMFLAGLDGAPEVSPHHVEEAAALRDGDAPPAPPPAQTAPAAADAPKSALPPEPPSPLAPARAHRPRLAIAAAGAALGLLILAGAAALLEHPIKAPRPQDQGPLDQVASTVPPRASPTPMPPPREAAAVNAPAPLPPQTNASSAPATHEAPASQSPASSPAPPREEAVAPDAGTDSTRVMVQYRGGATAEADRLIRALAAADPKFSRVETHAVQETPRDPTIRFFHPEDVGAAWELEAALSTTGQTWEVRNSTRSQHKPRRGTLEVLLP